MSKHHSAELRRTPSGPWVIDTRDLGRRAGLSRRYHRTVTTEGDFGLDLIRLAPGEEVEIDILAEAVVEGVLITGSVAGPTTAECSRCLDPFTGEVEIRVTELFAYPDSATDESTDEDEVSRVVDDLIDLEPAVRDSLLTALPSSPLCEPDCKGLCPECGGKWADLGPNHTHETMDPRWAALQKRFGGTEEEN
ncbi:MULTISPECIES: DUF177 domain-containing protein [unclassified Crossiella]|uniref:YceD family protein n=1 Tax=unclassified Crossiella TaxID=2620835 RepID=UPI00200001EC|nr:MULTISPECIES: DUF177 domain-containing protein [unclassified Crossiella]MCK2242383.1 DUF177 domain-containing protein [Crossiella sp. S99.2]MCK2254586.1 DUF177 domain-containing protein [Crossiella sp. S99.1]